MKKKMSEKQRETDREKVKQKALEKFSALETREESFFSTWQSVFCTKEMAFPVVVAGGGGDVIKNRYSPYICRYIQKADTYTHTHNFMYQHLPTCAPSGPPFHSLGMVQSKRRFDKRMVLVDWGGTLMLLLLLLFTWMYSKA